MFSRKIPSSVPASASITLEIWTNLKFYSFRKIIFALCHKVWMICIGWDLSIPLSDFSLDECNEVQGHLKSELDHIHAH